MTIERRPWSHRPRRQPYTVICDTCDDAEPLASEDLDAAIEEAAAMGWDVDTTGWEGEDICPLCQEIAWVS